MGDTEAKLLAISRAFIAAATAEKIWRNGPFAEEPGEKETRQASSDAEKFARQAVTNETNSRHDDMIQSLLGD